MKAKVGIIGDGNVGKVLARGLERAGYEVRTIGKDPQRVRDTGAWSDVVILAVPYGAVDDPVRELGDSLDGMRGLGVRRNTYAHVREDDGDADVGFGDGTL